MLIIAKRAVTETESQNLLQASYQVRKPFGVPTLIINPADYGQEPSSWRSIFKNSAEDRLSKEIFRTFQQNDTQTCSEKGLYSIYSKDIVQSVMAQVNRDNSKLSSDLMARSFPLNSLNLNLNVVVFQESHNAAKKSISRLLDIPMMRLPDYPGFNAQWNFMHLWHEIGHGLSDTSEAGADEVSALVCRHAFQDCAFLAVHADLRAAATLLSGDSFPDYKWPCVEAIDSTLAMKGPAPWNEIQAIGELARTAPHDNRTDSVQFVAWNLCQAAPMAFSFNKDLGQMATVCDQLLQNNVFKDAQQRRIAARFALAARRLSIGILAYKQSAPAP